LILFLLISCMQSTIHYDYIIINVNIVDTESGAILKNHSVGIINDKIVVVTKGILIGTDTQIIDGKEKYLMPGLWDMHVHLSYYGKDALGKLVGHGVIGVRDMGGNINEINEWSQLIKHEVIVGPTILKSGPFIDGPKKMDSLRASITCIVQNEYEARRVVDSLASIGVDFIKIHSRINRESFFAVVKEAKRHKLPLAVHIPYSVTPEEVINAGVSSIEHTESLLYGAIYLDSEKEMIDSIKGALSVLDSEKGSLLFQKLHNNGTYMDVTLVPNKIVFGSSENDFERNLPDELVSVVNKLHKHNVKLLAGSDFAYERMGITPGLDLHTELSLLVDAGLSPAEAIRTATINASRYLNLQKDYGTIHEKKYASMVLLDKNPLENISNTKTIRGLFLKGKYYDREQLNEMCN